VIAMVGSIVVIVGALKMKKLQGHTFAMVAAVLAILPCNGCCFLGIFAGIWCLIVLMKPEVKASFS
jgi:hypothetical protein